ncbi:MAG: ABC transporter ATP-binding protein [Clostridia bacterium]|nr:ABC transporter ATP-binding protein [Clostridia bacterium]
MLIIDNFSKSYDGKKFAVEDLSLRVEPGQIVAFIGPNGAGKTTTLKAICGIINYDKGDIFVNGIDVAKNPLQAKMNLAYLPDNPDLYEHLKGIEYLNFIADVFCIDQYIRKELIEKYSTLFKINNNLQEPIKTYSHGMKQKIAIISALIHKPKLFLLDEPFTGLDPQSSFDLKEILKQLVKEGCAVFYSTHVLEVAEKLATHIAIVRKGMLIKFGPTKEITGDKSLESLFLELANND